ncbi:hypothetical protein [Arenivirga flava]|uniref:DUF2238 domain-containing protein n=1 Tax=Arenivirga flava TaxID=1930060 RepID=A0AA37UDM8_9MICO|nr:hypothetical protein [Arenivirga flava]GMA28683.1 hypothetical protein GCM10025874_19360 [Arenivirga flava]
MRSVRQRREDGAADGAPLRDRLVAAFLRTPDSPALMAADALRIIGLLSVATGVAIGEPVTAAMFALTLVGLVAPRFLGVRGGFDAIVGATLLVAAWCSALELYITVPIVDLPVHFALNGALAALAVLALRTAGVVPAKGGRALETLLVGTVGVTLGVLWEFGEWAGHTWVDPEILVGYDDTIGDLLVGGLGAFAAALLMRWAGARQWGPLWPGAR